MDDYLRDVIADCRDGFKERENGKPAARYDSYSDDCIRRLIEALESAESKLSTLESDFTKAGWRSCIDHIIKPDSPCPVCRLDSLQAGVRNYLNATELDENGPAWYLLHGALANSSFVVERQSPK